jgi:ribosomal protein S18 acetylase RimI-like enzyme
MSGSTARVRVRPARPDDREFVLETAKRLAEFGPPPWRSPELVVTAESRVLHAFFEAPLPATTLLVAESADGTRLGFAYLETLVDYFEQRPHAHLAELAVSRDAEGSGAGGALLAASEEWARASGYSVLTLNVFEGNRHARAVYERRGFRPETLRYVKILG